MNEKFQVMIVEDEKIAGKIIRDNLEKEGYLCSLFENGEEALSHFKKNPVDLILLDYKLPGIGGEELLLEIKGINPFTPVIFMTAYSSVEKAVKLLKMGAYSYLNKPIEMDELLHNLNQALEKIILIEENRLLQQGLKEKYSFEQYIFNSKKMQAVMSLVLRAADSAANILLTGESGTGKEVIANIIHFYSRRKEKKFVKVNLAALPSTLIEAELFGSVKGAYTGSIGTRIGKFEEAHQGSIFLDEIGDLLPDIQVKLLRTLQEREITKLGSNEPIGIDIRLITASNRDLQILVKEKQFREDLFFRLNVINIHLPPLRERREDVKHLIDLFIKKYSQREEKNISTIAKDALNMLVKYDYPGNIRELENIIERAVVLSRGDILTTNDLPLFIHESSQNHRKPSEEKTSIPLTKRLKIIEKQIISAALEKNRFNQLKTAKELGISESGLRYKMSSLGIKNNISKANT